MPPETDELRVSDLMKPEPAQITSDWEAYFPKSYRHRKKQFSIIKKLYRLNRKKILLYPLIFILLLSLNQAFAFYLQKGAYELNITFENNSLSKWIDDFSFASNGATFISEEKAQDNNMRRFHLKFDSEESSHRFISVLEKEARINFLKNQEIEKEFLLKQVEGIRAKIHQNRISGNPDLLQLRADHDIHEYLLHGESSLKQRMEYYHKILYIEDFARHNVLEVFRLRKKELEIPLLKELEDLSAIIQKESPLEIKEMIDRIKVKQDEYLDELMQREMEDIPDKYLTPARKELLLEEKKLRILFHEWKLSESLFQSYREKLEKNKTDTLDKIYIQSDLRVAENLMKKVEAIDLENYQNQTPISVAILALPVNGMKLFEIIFYVSFFLLFYTLMWVRMVVSEKKFPKIDSAIEFEDRLKLSVAHEIAYKDLIFDPEKFELNSFYQQIGTFYSQAKNIVGKTELTLFHSGDAAYSTRDLAYLYAFGIATGGGRVCLVDSIQIGNWEFFGQLDRGFSLGLIEMINGKCDLKDSVYGTEFRNLFVSPINTELRISKSKSDENAGAQWDSKFDKVVFADSDLLADDILNFFKTHRVVIYYMVSSGDLQKDIEKDIAAFRAKNAEVKIIFKK